MRTKKGGKESKKLNGLGVKRVKEGEKGRTLTQTHTAHS